MLPLDPHDVWTTLNLAADTSACLFVGLHLGPRRAARLVEEQAAGVYERTMKPLLWAQLEAQRAAMLADVREIVDAHGGDLLRRFDEVRAQARADAEAQIAAARVQLEEQAAAMQAAAQEQAAQVIEQAKSEAGRFLAGRSAEAKAVQRIAEAEAEVQIGAWAVQTFGDFLGGRLVRYVKENHADAWRTALQNPEAAGRILGPIAGLAQRSMAASQTAAAPARDVADLSGW